MRQANFKNYYAIMNLEKEATFEQVKKAYRALARRWHPDRNPGDPGAEEKFKLLSEAYETLRDPDARREFDRVFRSFSQDAAAAGRLQEILKEMHMPPPGFQAEESFLRQDFIIASLKVVSRAEKKMAEFIAGKERTAVEKMLRNAIDLPDTLYLWDLPGKENAGKEND